MRPGGSDVCNKNVTYITLISRIGRDYVDGMQTSGDIENGLGAGVRGRCHASDAVVPEYWDEGSSTTIEHEGAW